MPKDEWAKYGKDWKYYKNKTRWYLQDSKTKSKATQSCKQNRTRMPYGPYKGECFNNMNKEYLEQLLVSKDCKEEWKDEIKSVLDGWASQRKRNSTGER